MTRSVSSTNQVTIINAHTSHVGEIVASRFNKKKSYKRYSHFAFSNFRSYDVIFLFNGSTTSFRRPILQKFLLQYKLVWIEIIAWLIFNRVNPIKYRIKFSSNSLISQKRLIIFSTDLIQFPQKEIERLASFTGQIYVHMTHYYYSPKKLESILLQLRNPILISEGKISDSGFFREYFSDKYRHEYINWVFDKRFIYKTEFLERKPKCLVLGSLPRIENFDFKSYFGHDNYLHPMRRKIYTRQNDYLEEFVCHYKFKVSGKLAPGKDTFGKQRYSLEYQTFDIVSELAKYSMFISPEEIIGLPSINFIDGMVAGCAYIGADENTYSLFGMIPGIHYIKYEKNDFDSLIRVVRHYQMYPDLVKQIGEAGMALARDKFSEEMIMKEANRVFSLG